MYKAGLVWLLSYSRLYSCITWVTTLFYDFHHTATTATKRKRAFAVAKEDPVLIWPTAAISFIPTIEMLDFVIKLLLDLRFFGFILLIIIKWVFLMSLCICQRQWNEMFLFLFCSLTRTVLWVKCLHWTWLSTPSNWNYTVYKPALHFGLALSTLKTYFYEDKLCLCKAVCSSFMCQQSAAWPYFRLELSWNVQLKGPYMAY